MAPTCKQLFNQDGYESVYREDDATWRYAYVTEVFKSETDETYWLASYCLSTDGETNELREGTADISQVEPYQVTVTRYRKITT